MSSSTTATATAAAAADASSKEDEYFALKAKATLQASIVKQAKKDGLAADIIAAEVDKLTLFRQQLLEMAGIEKSVNDPGANFNRKAFDELILRKMYVVPAFEIHNGPAGLFDYGPAACALKANVLALWRQHFVLEENMLEMECTALTPSSVLETSGHVERFTDFMVRDVKTGECFRADKLLEDVIDNFLKTNHNMPPDEQEEHRIIQVTTAFSS
jgi:glycyl-tRNA synthetase